MLHNPRNCRNLAWQADCTEVIHLNEQAHALGPERLLVRCMSWKEGGVWVAACIDLTLAAQGSTFEEARAKLRSQIASYVQEALTIDAEHASVLLSRKARLYDRLRYRFWAVLSRCKSALSRRPRLRNSVVALLNRFGLPPKTAYTQPLPLTVGA